MDIGPQNDPMHPAFRPPLRVSLTMGAIGVLFLLGVLIYVLVG